MIGSNLKSLRKRQGKSQEEVAIELGTNRSTYSGYENGVAQPSIDSLKLISKFFKLSIDQLLSVDFNNFSDKDWAKFESQEKERARGKQMRILSTLVDTNDEDLIELIPEKAKAGYSTGYSDPNYMESLPRIQLPFLASDRKHRAFEVSGDSMLPIASGSIIVGEFVQNWVDIKSDTPCILLTKEEGIVFKIVFNHIEADNSLLLVSNNPSYEPYSVSIENIMEIWNLKAIVSQEFPSHTENFDQLGDGIKSIQNDLKLLLKKIK